MLKMMKYEYRRGVFPLMVVIAAIAAVEILFLIGVFAHKSAFVGIGLVLLIMGGFAAYAFVLVYGVVIYSQDLKNKTGYMVFMTPLSSFKIIGAKLLSILLTGVTLVAFLVALMVIDYNVFKAHNSGVADVEIILNEMLGTSGTSLGSVIANLAGMIIVGLIQFFTMITIAYLAVSLASTVLQNKKIKGVASVVLFVVIYLLMSYVAYKLPFIGKGMQSENMLEAVYALIPRLSLYVVCMVGSFVGSGALLSRKISL